MKEENRKMIYDRVKAVYESSDANAIRQKYRNEELPEIGETIHKRLTGHGVASAYWVIRNGGTPEEVEKMILYALVCIDARKYRLDYARFNSDYGISEIFHKYAKGVPKEKFWKEI